MSIGKRLFYIFKACRPNQWLKNLIVYTSIIFCELFNPTLLLNSTYTFIIFCLISSASYIFNDIIDLPFDQKHPQKKNRPIASGKVSMPDATFTMFILVLLSITLALFLRISLGILVFVFFLMHAGYSLYFKKHILFDIFAIAISFMLRLLSGEFITGIHVPIWLWLTTFYFALFIAAVKRHSEYINQGTKTRQVLKDYTEQLLSFLVNCFAVMSIFAYSFYAFLEKPPHIKTKLSELFYPNPAETVDPEPRKWFMLTIPMVVFAIARYAQLLYERRQGEAPEKIIAQDKVLIIVTFLWGLTMIGLIYVF
jgi:4-hydroxybenzoate polyprenyltransferase